MVQNLRFLAKAHTFLFDCDHPKVVNRLLVTLNSKAVARYSKVVAQAVFELRARKRTIPIRINNHGPLVYIYWNK